MGGLCSISRRRRTGKSIRLIDIDHPAFAPKCKPLLILPTAGRRRAELGLTIGRSASDVTSVSRDSLAKRPSFAPHALR